MHGCSEFVADQVSDIGHFCLTHYSIINILFVGEPLLSLFIG